MIRLIHSRGRRFATALAVMAVLAFALDGALGANHHLSAAAPGHTHPHGHGAHGHHAHSHHAHGHDVDLSDHQPGHGDVSHDIDMPAADYDGALASAPDADENCWLNACFAAVVLPCPSAQALPVLFCGIVTAVHPRQGDGIEPDGLRKPPRTRALT